MRYRTRGRRYGARRRPQWAWATTGAIIITDDNISSPPPFLETVNALIPPAWVAAQCAQRNTDHITTATILLWLSYTVTNPSSGFINTSDCTGFIVRETGLEGQSSNQNYACFAEPRLPSAVTNWDADAPPEGTDPFLWVNRYWAQNPSPDGQVPGLVPGPIVVNTTESAQGTYQHGLCITGTHDPQVVVKTRRRLLKNDGLGIGLRLESPNGNGLLYELAYAARCLVS